MAAATLLPAPPPVLAQAGIAAFETPARTSATTVLAQIDTGKGTDAGNPMTGLMGGNVVVLPDTGGEFTLSLPVTGQVQKLRTRKGADIALRITGNKAEELHLHGYDIKLKLKPGETAQMNVKASRSGRFELETHSGHRTVLILEIMP